MKKLSFIFLAGIILSCNNNGASSKDATNDSVATAATATTAMAYPYTIEHPDNWQMGSSANTMIALSSLKAFEGGKIDESLKYFGDSISVQLYGMDKKLSKDSLKAVFANAWKGYKTLKVKMNDWESVISKDKSEEYVTLWYRQSWETTKGVKDSLDFITDLQIKDGKIIKLTDYSRQLH